MVAPDRHLPFPGRCLSFFQWFCKPGLLSLLLLLLCCCFAPPFPFLAPTQTSLATRPRLLLLAVAASLHRDRREAKARQLPAPTVRSRGLGAGVDFWGSPFHPQPSPAKSTHAHWARANPAMVAACVPAS